MPESNVFQTVSANPVGRSTFDLSYTKKFDFDMGQLIPIMCEEALTNDVWRIGNSCVIRFQPLVAPILHRIDAYVHYFFVPFRIMWPGDSQEELLRTTGWTTFFTGGRDGELAPTLPILQRNSSAAPVNIPKGSLGDFFGMPVGVDIPDEDCPLLWPWIAYNRVRNDYYIDVNLSPPSGNAVFPAVAGGTFQTIHNQMPARRAWSKDYFTSALPFQQRGVAPALSSDVIFNFAAADFQAGQAFSAWQSDPTDGAEGLLAVNYNSPTNPGVLIDNGQGTSATAVQASAAMNQFFGRNTAVTGFDVTDFRLFVQIQRWMELSARSGPRYIEALKAHFRGAPSDSRLQRAEYIGGTRYPVIVSEVLQTSSTDETSPQANMAGHGITANGGFAGTYRCQEPGVILGMLSVLPSAAYQQGMPRWLSRRTRFDYYWPEFANLSEQAVLTKELYMTDDTTVNNSIFGYQGHWDEYRVNQDMVCNNFRDTLDYWHLGRQFAQQPLLNSTFIECSPRKDIFAVQNVPGLLCNFANNLTVSRPLPALSTPGLLDHVF